VDFLGFEAVVHGEVCGGISVNLFEEDNASK
jgi:hypothetical protein